MNTFLAVLEDEAIKYQSIEIQVDDDAQKLSPEKRKLAEVIEKVILLLVLFVYAMPTFELLVYAKLLSNTKASQNLCKFVPP